MHASAKAEAQELIMKRYSFFFLSLLLVATIACEMSAPTVTIVPSIETVAATTSPIPPTETPLPTNTPLPTATLTPHAGSEKLVAPDDLAVVFVPAGEFLMGSDNGTKDEAPAHVVYLDSFWINKTEIPSATYLHCVEAEVCTPPDKNLPTKLMEGQLVYWSYIWDDPFFAFYPITNVTWEQADTFCKWYGGRLPTEAEWEKAARGTDGRQYPWGNDEPYIVYRSITDGSILVGDQPTAAPHGYGPANKQYAKHKGGVTYYVEYLQLNYNGQVGSPQKVRQYPEGMSPYGVMGMAGNVWEYVSDWYEKSYYSISPTQNPMGPATGNFHVVRGGSFNSSYDSIFTSNRAYFGQNSVGYLTTGFRCAFAP